MQAVDAEPRERSAMHYVATARMMAECVGSALAEDFADASIKEVLAAGLPAANSQPFNAGEGKGWAEFKVTPAHRALALRVQGRAQDSRMSCEPPWVPWLRGGRCAGRCPGPRKQRRPHEGDGRDGRICAGVA